MAEAMWVNLGGEIKMVKGDGGKLERRYFMDGVVEGDKGIGIGELMKTQLKYKKTMRVAEATDPRTLDYGYVDKQVVTLDELAKTNMWLMMLGEAHWELTGKAGVMNRKVEGRRNIYRWHKYFNYDVYAEKLGGARGFPIYTEEGETPILELNRSDYMTKYREKMGAFLWSVEDFSRKDPNTGEVVENSRVMGINNVLADKDEALAKQFLAIMEGKFIDNHRHIKDIDLFRMAFLTDEEMREKRGVKPEDSPEAKKFWERWKTAKFEDKDKEVIKRLRWDRLLNYLASDGLNGENKGKKVFSPRRVTLEERDYVLGKLMGGVRDDETGRWNFRGRGGAPTDEDQEKAAKWFFEHFSERFYFWGRLEHNQHLKEMNYTKQAAGLAPKMLQFAEQPTADRLLEWVLPMFGFNKGDEIRQIAFRAARWNLRLLSKFQLPWEVDLAEARSRGVGSHEFDGLDEYGYPKLKRKSLFRRPLETAMIWWKGAGSIKGHKALDAWAKKQYIDKLWHVGAIEWVQKEALMAEFLTALPFGGALGGRLLSALIRKPEQIDDKKKLVKAFWAGIRVGALTYAKVTQFSYLNLWIHDWGKATGSFWNEVVAPGLAGENAKALQVQV